MMKRMRFYEVSYDYTYTYNGSVVADTKRAYIAIDVSHPLVIGIKNIQKTLDVLKGVVEDVYQNDAEFAGLKATINNVRVLDYLTYIDKYNTIKYTNKVLMTDDYIFIM